MKLVNNTLVAFSAKAGTVAQDGSGANSPFTAALLKHIATPGLDVRLAFGRIRDVVVGPDGFVYLAMHDPYRIVRLVPADGDAPRTGRNVDAGPRARPASLSCACRDREGRLSTELIVYPRSQKAPASPRRQADGVDRCHSRNAMCNSSARDALPQWPISSSMFVSR